jgi:hypothetical protein
VAENDFEIAIPTGVRAVRLLLVETGHVGSMPETTRLQPHVPLDIGRLRLELVAEDTVALRGQLLFNRGHDAVAVHLDDLHQRAVSGQLRRFTVDVRTLDFVNSSAIRIFVDWAAKAERAKYCLRFLTDQHVTWQRLSFSVLRSLSPEAVEVIDGDGQE